MTQLAEAKAEHEHQAEELFQTEGLFEDLDPAPVLRGAAADYLLQLVGIAFRRQGDPQAPVWRVWALAPMQPRWQAWAEHYARDQDRHWIAGVEHVWLTRSGLVHRALVHIHDGVILQPRPSPAEESS